jgi:hypothetical protein
VAAIEEAGALGPIEEKDISHPKTIRITLRCAPLKTRQDNSALDVVGDTHGTHPALPEGDIFVHCGDITHFGEFSELKEQVAWLKGLRFKHVVSVAGKQAGTRTMIELLQQGSKHGWERLQQAVQQALDLGCTDAAAVRHLLVFGELGHAPVERFALEGLERYERPLPVMSEYDLLLDEVAEVAR